MPTTRSSARKSGATSPASSLASTGSKRKANTSPGPSPAAKGKKSSAPKKQKTIEETLPDAEKDDLDAADTNTEVSNGNVRPGATPSKIDDAGNDIEMKDAEVEQGNSKLETTKDSQDANAEGNKAQTSTAVETKSTSTGQNGVKPGPDDGQSGHQVKPTDGEASVSTKDTVEASSTAPKPTGESIVDEKVDATKDAVEHSSQREKSTPSSILEKGIIYFFFRGRVGIDDPSDVNDIARSYIVLRPLSRGAKLTDGSLGDQNNLRLLALPKKVLPKGPNDRFMVFVEKSKVNLENLKKEFLSSSDYETKTAGTRHSPAATPIGEGVYALTSTGRETHLAYILTIPKDISEVQKDIGLEAKGSWVTSVKNPQHKGPAQAQLPEDPKFPQEILDEFRTLRWGQLQPKHLDYENCQLLLIGHKDHSFAKATEVEGEEKDPKEEIEKLGEEEERRIEHLEGDDTVFEDLDIDAKDYPSVQTTW